MFYRVRSIVDHNERTTRHTASRIQIKTIYLCFVVGFVWSAYVYIPMDFLCPYKRFKSIICPRNFLIHICLSHGVFIYVYTYVHLFLHMYIYIYISPIFYTYRFLYILLYICVFFQAIIYWPHTRPQPPARPPATTEHLFRLIHWKFSI